MNVFKIIPVVAAVLMIVLMPLRATAQVLMPYGTTFTVINDHGQSSTVSATVRVNR